MFNGVNKFGHIFNFNSKKIGQFTITITSLTVINHIIPRQPCQIVAPTKNISRTEWFVEKATEIGIDEITPLLCEHSERKHMNRSRTEKVMIAAMKQSLKFWLPKLNPVISFREFIAKPVSGQKFIAWLDPENKTTLLKKAYIPGNDATILIGPEGDQITMAAADGFRLSVRRATLSSPVMRSISAVIPARALSELARIAADGDQTLTMVMPPGRGQVVFRWGDVELVSQLIEGSFPDYEQIIPRRYDTRAVLSTTAF